MNRMDWRARFLRSGKRGRAVYGRKTRANEQERTAAIVPRIISSAADLSTGGISRVGRQRYALPCQQNHK